MSRFTRDSSRGGDNDPTLTEKMMISVSPFEAGHDVAHACREVAYLLRRADHETVAAIRADDPRASDSHAVLARHYGERSRDLIARLDGQDEAPCPE